MMLDDIAAYIVAYGGLVTGLGVDLFIGMLPDESEAGVLTTVALYEYQGEPSMLGFGTSSFKTESPALQVVVRGAADDYDTPRTKIHSIYKALGTIQGLTLGGVKYYTLRNRQAPFFRNRDDIGRVYFAVNFIVDKEVAP